MKERYINNKEFKKWEKDEKNNKSSYICHNCGNKFVYSKNYKCWACLGCGLVTSKENLIKNHTRVY